MFLDLLPIVQGINNLKSIEVFCLPWICVRCVLQHDHVRLGPSTLITDTVQFTSSCDGTGLRKWYFLFYFICKYLNVFAHYASAVLALIKSSIAWANGSAAAFLAGSGLWLSACINTFGAEKSFTSSSPDSLYWSFSPMVCLRCTTSPWRPHTSVCDAFAKVGSAGSRPLQYESEWCGHKKKGG